MPAIVQPPGHAKDHQRESGRHQQLDQRECATLLGTHDHPLKDIGTRDNNGTSRPFQSGQDKRKAASSRRIVDHDSAEAAFMDHLSDVYKVAHL